MRIGVLTFHYAHNYGAVLQAYALKKYLISIGHETKIVNYQNRTVASKYTRVLRSGIHLREMQHKWAIKKEIDFLWNFKYAIKDWRKQWERFETFISKNLSDISRIHNPRQLEGMFDMLIVGSDQVWSSTITGGLDKFYLLDFPFRGKKISYAASIDCGCIPEKERAVFREALKQFDAVSVREKSLSDSILQELGIRAETVLDPTLLLDKEEYIGLAENSTFSGKKAPFIFAYYVYEDIKMQSTVKYIAEKNGLEIMELHYYMKKEFDPYYQRADLGPYEFLDLILHADTIVTNSFHGTVFSILFEKNFYSFYQKNVRIQHLLEALGLPERHLSEANAIIPGSKVDYSVVKERLEAYRTSSYAFLRDVME